MNFSLQLRELFIAYGLSAGGMLIGLLAMRADHRAYFRWPVYSVMVMALGVVLWNLLRKHVLPLEWGAMYYSALALYFLLGLALGLLLGRVAGRKTPKRDTRGTSHGQSEEKEVEVKADAQEEGEAYAQEKEGKGQSKDP
ncbi:MAG: hypothetical protein ABI769_14215 [Pseudomonadota bacterium]